MISVWQLEFTHFGSISIVKHLFKNQAILMAKHSFQEAIFLIVDLASKPLEASTGGPENLRFRSVLNTYIRTRNSGI